MSDADSPVPTLSTIERLEAAADTDTSVRFVGSSVMGPDGPVAVPWREVHDDARAVGVDWRAIAQGSHPL